MSPERRARKRAAAASIAAVIVVGAAGPATADAARPATAAEAAAIERTVMTDCTQPGCSWGGGATVSTKDERFAVGRADGEFYSHLALLQRTTARSQDWSVRAVQGGGLLDCRDWYDAAPASVVGDLRLHGLLLGTSGERCPARRLRARRCGSVAVVTEGVAARAGVRSRGVRCSLARRIIRRSSSTGRVPRRWQCLGSGEGSLCVRGADAGTALARRWALPYVEHISSDLRVRASKPGLAAAGMTTRVRVKR